MPIEEFVGATKFIAWLAERQGAIVLPIEQTGVEVRFADDAELLRVLEQFVKEAPPEPLSLDGLADERGEG